MATTDDRAVRKVVAALLFAGSLAGCGDTAPTGIRYDLEELRAAFTPDIAALLDVNGRLPLTQGTDGLTEITGARAAELASAYWRFMEPWNRPSLKSARPDGYAKESVPCDRAYYSAAAYEVPFNPVIPEIYHLWMGPFWLVPLCDEGRQQAVIAVTARATDWVIQDDGWIEGTYSGQTFVRGVRDGSVPISPEAGAVAIARTFGVRVSAVPELRRRPGWEGAASFGSLWYYRLEHPVVVQGRTSDYPREVTELAVGFDHALGWSFDYLVDPGTERPYIVVDNPWYANESRVQPIYHWDDELGRCCSTHDIFRRVDVAGQYEIVRAIPR